MSTESAGYRVQKFVLSRNCERSPKCHEATYLAVARCFEGKGFHAVARREIGALIRHPKESIELALEFMIDSAVITVEPGHRFRPRSDTVVADAMMAFWSLDPNRAGIPAGQRSSEY
jgi:hypothetical protein